MTSLSPLPPPLPGDAALFLDFDGSLVPMAPTPDSIAVPTGLVPLLRDLQGRLGGAVAIISGREIAVLDAYLQPLQLACAGAHGAQRRNARGQQCNDAPGDISAVIDACEQLAKAHPALYVEPKQSGVALHYRRDPSLEGLCLRSLQAMLAHRPQWTLLRGKQVLEMLPVGASKGRAMDAFMQEPPFVGRTPFFVGDDISDESGFTAVLAERGVAIKVGAGVSCASHRLDDVEAVYHWLQAACTQHRMLSALGRPAEVQP
ncbi:trehalose-phosphatase [Comamonas sp. MYb21]|uniref:trehalose-phosphatase n=1 Tax=Comamonas sp. MYb21 TaxID=1848648 RepID=UPI0030AF81DB